MRTFLGPSAAISMVLSLFLCGCEGISTFQSANPNISSGAAPAQPGLTAAQQAWNKYIGCYQELTFDGSPVQLGTAKIERADGQIWGQVYDIKSTRPIPAIVITLSPPSTSVYYVPLDISVFTDRGHFTSDNDGDHYRFHGLVGDEIDGTREELDAHAQVDIKKLEDGRLEISLDRFVDKTQRPELYDAKATATLLPADCETINSDSL